jgi:hypothetical protein
MKTSVAVAVAVAACACAGVLPSTDAAYCTGKPSPNATANLQPILIGAPRLVRSVPNGKLFEVGTGDDVVPVVHLWGTPHEMGVAHGQLQTEAITTLMTAVMKYIEDQAAQAINGTDHHLKPWFVDLVADIGVESALALTYDVTRPYTGDYFDAELQGMADATNVTITTMRHVHMIGELTKGSCSLYGAWGTATAEAGGNLMQLRALDWDVDGPFKDHPEIVVYHPTPGSGNGHAFTNIAWTGFIGSITGMSSSQMAISEIGVSFPDASFGKESRFGVPFTYLLRDILQFDTSIESVEKHLGGAHRTCDLIFGVGDGKTEAAGSPFRSVQYSASVANFFNDTTMEPVYDWHPRMDNVVYYGMDWLCPGYTQAMWKQLTKFHGNITAVNTIREIVPIVETGNLHVAVYDLTTMVLHVATARKTGATGGQYAYQRSFIKIDMNALYAEPKP